MAATGTASRGAATRGREAAGAAPRGAATPGAATRGAATRGADRPGADRPGAATRGADRPGPRQLGSQAHPGALRQRAGCQVPDGATVDEALPSYRDEIGVVDRYLTAANVDELDLLISRRTPTLAAT